MLPPQSPSWKETFVGLLQFAKILYGQTLKNLVDRLMVDYNFGTLEEKMKKEEWLFYMFNKSRDLRYDDPQ